MPLHDWTDDRGWDSLHLVWQNRLLDWIQPLLPGDYRAYLGSVPALTIDLPGGRPDIGVRNWSNGLEPSTSTAATAIATMEPDTESVATFELDPLRAIHIERNGQLIAAVELISPRNKDRPAARTQYLNRYLGYLQNGVHLLLVDALPRPAGFSFADAIAQHLGLAQPNTPSPFAVSYRVGESVPEGTVLAVWRRPLAIGQPLATIPLPLNVEKQIPIDLEVTYREAAKRVYLT